MVQVIDQFLSQYSFRYVLALLGTAIVFQLWRKKEHPNGDGVSPSSWTIWQLIALLLILEISGGVTETILRDDSTLQGGLFGSFLLWSYPLFIVLLFLRLFGAKPAAVGLTADGRLTELLLVGSRWGFSALCLVMLLGIVMPEDIMLRPFQPYKSLQNQGILLKSSSVEEFFHSMKILLGIGLGCVTEEVVFRGLLFKTLRRKLNLVPSMVMSAGCFMLGHGRVSIPLFVMGCGNAILLEKRNSLLPAIVIHFIWNVGLDVTGSFLSSEKFLVKTYFETAFAITLLASILAWAVSLIVVRGRDGKGASPFFRRPIR